MELVRDGTEVESVVERDGHLDLLILDPEVPLLTESRLQGLLVERLPPLPLIVHGHWEVCARQAILGCVSAFVVMTIPIVASLAMDHYLGEAQAFALPIGKTIVTLLAITIVPVGIGMLVRKRWPALAERTATTDCD